MPNPIQSGQESLIAATTAVTTGTTVAATFAATYAATYYERSGAAAYGMSVEQFAGVLDDVLRKHVPAKAASSSSSNSNSKSNDATAETDAFCAALKLEELALARGCAAGNERAWQDFIDRYRQKLHRMALHITRDGAYAAELADSLFADLYGVNARDGVRNSKLLSYTGRGSLEGWLRTVMAQEFINRYRKQKRTVSLEEQTEEGVQFAAVGSGACEWGRYAAGSGDRSGSGGTFAGGPVYPRGVLFGRADARRYCARARAARIECEPAARPSFDRAQEAYSGGVAGAGDEPCAGGRGFGD